MKCPKNSFALDSLISTLDRLTSDLLPAMASFKATCSLNEFSLGIQVWRLGGHRFDGCAEWSESSTELNT